MSFEQVFWWFMVVSFILEVVGKICMAFVYSREDHVVDVKLIRHEKVFIGLLDCCVVVIVLVWLFSVRGLLF